MYCNAMAYGDVPLKRFVTGETRRLVYVSSSNAKAAPKSGVGFPHRAVYKYDESVFERLRAARTKSDSQEFERLKRQLTPWR